MEVKEIGQDLNKAFDAWNKGQATDSDVANLDKAIRFASSNGIDLVLEMPKHLLDARDGTTKPMYREDAIAHSSGTNEKSIIFEIPAESTKITIAKSKMLTLEVVKEYRDLGPTILLKHKDKSLIGTFIPGEISSLGVK